MYAQILGYEYDTGRYFWFLVNLGGTSVDSLTS